MLPFASVVVATYNRKQGLARLLDALAAQQSMTPPFEVIVVDDGSGDGTAALLRETARASDLHLVVLRHDANRGPAAARNLGWQEARGAVVCFTDDDCIPHPAWVSALVAASSGADIVQGRTVPAPNQWCHRGPFSHTMTVLEEDGFYSTCNIAYRRPVLEKIGGFDESFTQAYGEDTDLAWRAISAGASTGFASEAQVEHEVRPRSFGDHLRSIRRREGLVHAIGKHPGLRDRLPYRGYVHPPHLRLLVLLIAGLVIVGRAGSPYPWLISMPAAAWYAEGCRRWRMAPPTRRGWLPAIPLIVIADFVELIVLVRASVRYRTVMW